MGGWSEELLASFAREDEVRVAPGEGNRRASTIVWCVVAEGRVFLRAYRGPRSRWHRAALEHGRGQVRVGERWVPVRFVPVAADDPVQAGIDAAYRAKYGSSPYLAPMLEPGPRQATVELVAEEGTT